ncbi:uncharacterized protein LOC131954926 [Physella acuta]|uniref:uncharacterized protein LOC131954926 n=1 Tax=Physella acuta TaxID=109671 RepID=UPI0027DD476A|nr:uncharacterized protein LOC131954926 [Physella acuta]
MTSIRHNISLEVLLICCILWHSYVNGQSQSTCPEEPTGVVLKSEVDQAGVGVLACSLNEYPADDVDIRFTWLVDNSTRDVWVRQIKGPEKTGSIRVTDIDVDLYEKEITCFAELKYPGEDWCYKLQSNIVTPKVMCPALSPITLTEGMGSERLQLSLSSPPSMFCNAKKHPECSVEVLLELVPHLQDLKCTNNDIIPQAVLQTPSCAVEFTKRNWKTGVSIPIKAVMDGVKDGNRKVQLQILVAIKGQRTKIVDCGSVEVTVIDADRTSLCRSHNDPHLVTFDQFTYDNQLVGEFVLYKHKTFPFEVRVQQLVCSPPWNSATCNCAVAVKVGDDVISFYGCNGPSVNVQMYKNGDLTPGTSVKRLGDGKKYEVYIPTRTKVTIENAVTLLNVYVDGSMADSSNTEGMCGNFNGNKADELGGERIQEFNIRWRRTDSIFQGVRANNSATLPTYCSCVRLRPAVCRAGLDVFRCDDIDYSDITDLLVKHSKPPVLTNMGGRRRRQATDNQSSTSKSPKYTKAEATQICKDKIEKSKTVGVCGKYLSNTTVPQSIDDCIFDLEATGESQWAEAHVSTLAETCMSEARKDPAVWTGNGTTPGQPEFPRDIAVGLCVKDCGVNGDCVNAICQCKNGYAGETCQISPDARPVVSPGVEVCDVATTSCGTFVVGGFNFTRSRNLTCVYTFVSSNQTALPGVSRGTAAAEYINLYQQGCSMTQQQPRSALVSIAAGDVTSQHSYMYVVYNSSCQTCSLSGQGQNNVTCQWKSNHCVINDQCYSDLQVDPENSCQVCNVTISTSRWTWLEVPECPEPKEVPTTIIIAVCVVLGVLLIAAVIVAIVCFKRKNKSKNLL